MALHRIERICDLLRSCLVDGRRMLFSMVEQVFLQNERDLANA